VENREEIFEKERGEGEIRESILVISDERGRGDDKY
jgi:hypothetical protein